MGSVLSGVGEQRRRTLLVGVENVVVGVSEGKVVSDGGNTLPVDQPPWVAIGKGVEEFSLGFGGAT